MLNKKNRFIFSFIMALAIHFLLINMRMARMSQRVSDFQIPDTVNIFLGQMEQIKDVREDADEQEVQPVQAVAEQPMEKKSVEKISQPVLPEKLEKPDIESPVTKESSIANEIEAAAPQDTAEIKPSEIMTNAEVSDKKIESAQPVSTQENPDSGITQIDTLQTDQEVNLSIVIKAIPKYKVNSQRIYPPIAKKRGYRGTVVLTVQVNMEGRVDDLYVDVSSGYTMLDRAALNSVRKWLFEPGRKGDEKIDMWINVPVTFK